MKRVLITLFVLVAALSVASITLAQSTPAEDPKDNTCYAGGVWEGKCDWPTEAEDKWAWTCGWYYARVLDGRIGAEEAPVECKLLIDAGGDDGGELEGICYPSSTRVRSILYTGPVNTFGNFARYESLDCSGTPVVITEGLFEGDDDDAVEAVCAPLSPNGDVIITGPIVDLGYTTAPANLWFCFYE
jgi:hypothetical protein